MTQSIWTQQEEDSTPAQDPHELTDAELNQVAGSGGNGNEGAQPIGSDR